MNDNIYLEKMTREIAESYFMEFAFDPMVFKDGQAIVPFVYSGQWVDNYLKRHRNHVHLCIMLKDKPIGEILLKCIDQISKTAVFSIHLQNDSVKGKGYGTQAVKLAIEYSFNELKLKVLYADAIKKNKRSIHMLEKAGFHFTKEDNDFVYYEMRNPAETDIL